MPRTAAERLLDEFLQRIAALNEDSRFLARVERAIVFGSYLSGGDQLGDVDVAVHLVPRSADPKKHREVNDRRVAARRKSRKAGDSVHSSTKLFGGSKKPCFSYETVAGA